MGLSAPSSRYRVALQASRLALSSLLSLPSRAAEFPWYGPDQAWYNPRAAKLYVG